MHSLTLTQHASSRLDQRSIPNSVVELLLDYGAVQRRHGADVYALDKRGRRRLRRDLGKVMYSRLSGMLNSYAVVADNGAVITGCHRLRRIFR